MSESVPAWLLPIAVALGLAVIALVLLWELAKLIWFLLSLLWRGARTVLTKL